MRRCPQNMLGMDCLAQPAISGGAPFQRAAEVGCGGVACCKYLGVAVSYDPCLMLGLDLGTW